MPSLIRTGLCAKVNTAPSNGWIWVPIRRLGDDIQISIILAALFTTYAAHNKEDGGADDSQRDNTADRHDYGHISQEGLLLILHVSFTWKKIKIRRHYYHRYINERLQNLKKWDNTLILFTPLGEFYVLTEEWNQTYIEFEWKNQNFLKYFK